MEDVWQHLVIMRGDSETKASTDMLSPEMKKEKPGSNDSLRFHQALSGVRPTPGVFTYVTQ